MILTVTPNPSIDLLFAADRLLWDDANRIASPRRRAGGQGINLTRAVRELGGEARALALLGGAAGTELSGMLAAEGTPLRSVAIDGETRVFVGVRESASARSLLLNSRGPTLGPGDGDRLLEATHDELRRLRPRWLVCSGSLPPGIPDDLYARAGAIAREAGVDFVVDCDGAPLRFAVDGGCRVLSPNAHEAERLLGLAAGAIDGPATAADAARAIVDRFGATCAFVTLGATGAVAADAAGAWHAQAGDAPAEASAVGAGDAFLAAALLALGDGASIGDALSSGVAAGSAVLRSSGSALLYRVDHAELLHKASARRIV